MGQYWYIPDFIEDQMQSSTPLNKKERSEQGRDTSREDCSNPSGFGGQIYCAGEAASKTISAYYKLLITVAIIALIAIVLYYTSPYWLSRAPKVGKIL